MTEADWLAHIDPQPMLEFLRGKLSERKLRLFTAACCRRVWNLLADERSREAVVVVERLADGSVTRKEWSAARAEARAAAREDADLSNFSDQWRAKQAAADALREDASEAARRVAHAYWRYRAKLAEYLRDVTGNPFRPPTDVAPWRTPTVLALAQQVYEELDFGALRVLADALEDAGCDDPILLGHCRGEGPHVRGCWAVDAVLGKG
jgi:hypothetical protein